MEHRNCQQPTSQQSQQNQQIQLVHYKPEKVAHWNKPIPIETYYVEILIKVSGMTPSTT